MHHLNQLYGGLIMHSSTKRYNALIQQQMNIFKILHNIDATVRK